MKRIFLIVLDSLGIGALPDAPRFGDEGSNTLRSVLASPEASIPTLTRLGLLHIDGVMNPAPASPLHARVARMTQQSAGKDTTVGHWEIAGLVTDKPLPTYPHGFPPAIIDAFSHATGRGVLCNKPYSGTQVLTDYGRAHQETGEYIVYTSADSVFQIAAHEDIIPLSELYDACEKARSILTGEHGVGRVIARPFTGSYPHYQRTKNRHDYSLLPPSETMLPLLCDAGKTVLAIGKIRDIFAGVGITQHIPTGTNAEGMTALANALNQDFEGLCFANLVDFDMLYGHRNDTDGYARALSAFDSWLSTFLPKLLPDDLVMITADHGCDPGTPSTDHSREYTPCLIIGSSVTPQNLGTRKSFADIAASVLSYFSIPCPFEATSML